jgi:uncharacterized protein YcaQ
MARRGSAFDAAQARRIALAAQGFGERGSTRPLLPAIRRMGVIQIDSVNVLVRSHYLPLFSRLGAYDRDALDRLAYTRRRSLFEYWGHEASLLPIEFFPLFRWRMERARRGEGTWGSIARIGREQRGFVANVLREIEARGPLGAGDLSGYARTGEAWWGWSDHKRAVEYLFWTGRLTTAARRNFERIYDLTERVIPAAVRERDAGSEADQQRALIEIAARAHGIAAERDLRDYFRLAPADARARIGELAESGLLLPVSLHDRPGTYYLHAAARVPRAMHASALLSPFDPIVWERSRALALFDFHFRLEIYTPAHKRVHGYYVLPFLFGDRLAGRVDLKSDRAKSALLVQAVHFEPGARTAGARSALRTELAALAAWLGLERVRLAGSARL